MIIGLSGFKGSGKDTAADYLVERYGFIRLSFAKKLKESAAALFKLEPEIWEDLKNQHFGCIILMDEDGDKITQINFREFLQRYGKESHRDIFGDNFWVEHALNNLNEFSNYVITDCRFENEMKTVRELGGIIVRIERKSAEPKYISHSSELPPKSELIDWFVDNNGTIEQLHENLDLLIPETVEENYVV